VDKKWQKKCQQIAQNRFDVVLENLAQMGKNVKMELAFHAYLLELRVEVIVEIAVTVMMVSAIASNFFTFSIFKS